MSAPRGRGGRPLASGAATRSGALSLVTHFEPDLFGEIRAFAAEHRMSAGEAVRTLCQWGLLEAQEEAEKEHAALTEQLRRRRLKVFERRAGS